MNKKIQCDCGAIICLYYLPIHLKKPRHIKNMPYLYDLDI
jgi:hypothetical protein